MFYAFECVYINEYKIEDTYPITDIVKKSTQIPTPLNDWAPVHYVIIPQQHACTADSVVNTVYKFQIPDGIREYLRDLSPLFYAHCIKSNFNIRFFFLAY